MKATRREFLRTGSLGGALLVIGFRLEAPEAAAAGPFSPNAWISIDGDGGVRLTVAKTEMGQGVRTALPMILAEELEADWSRVEVVQASPGPDFPDMGTGGSDSVWSGWRPLRKAGAAAREVLIAAAAGTWGVPPGSCRAEAGAIVHVPSGRRAGYGALAAAAARLPVPADPPLKDPKDYRIVGHRTLRVDAPRIATGTAVYTADVRLPGLLQATIVRPPTLEGSLRSFDDRRVRSIPGIKGVYPVSSGVAIVAESTWAALRAREDLVVSWEPGPHADFDSEACFHRLEEASSRTAPATRREGDAAARLASASRRLEAVYRYGFQTHAAVDTMGFVAQVENGRCRLWGGTQNAQRVQRDVGTLLGLAPEKVEVAVTRIGGGFGRRLPADYAVEAAEVSRAAGAPVHVQWTREDDTRHGHFHPGSVHRMAGAIDGDGAPVAWLHRKAGSYLTLYPPSESDLTDLDWLQNDNWGQYDIPYAIPNILCEYAVVPSPLRSGPWRSVYSPPNTFARESFLDELAHAGGRDPLGLRLALLERPRILNVGRLSIDRARYRHVLALAAEKAGWSRPPAPRPGRRVGRGIAGNVYSGSTHVAYVAEVSVGAEGDVQVHRMVAVVDCGLVVNPLGVEAQVEGGIAFGLSAALGGEITVREGRVVQSGYADYPLLRLDQMPEVEIHLVPSDAHPSGMGEPPVPPAAPAVTNAIFAATGRRVRRLPLHPADLKAD